MNLNTLAAAYVRGCDMRCAKAGLSERLLETPLSALSEQEIESILLAGREADLKMYRFKEKNLLARVAKVLGFLRGVSPESLLDVGSGRGVFLFPFLTAFEGVPVTSFDILDERVEFLSDISRGGVDTLTACRRDICLVEGENRYDIVTMLEVLEHIPDAQRAVDNAVRLAKRFVVVSVPSKPDDNPEHIHLFTKEKLGDMFLSAGAKHARFDGVTGHMVMIASL